MTHNTPEQFKCGTCGFVAHDMEIFQNHDCYADEPEREKFDAKAHYGEPPERRY